VGPVRRRSGRSHPRGRRLIAKGLAWLPAAAGLVYAVVVARRLQTIVTQLTWNADYDSQMVIAQSVGAGGKAGRAIIIQLGYYWLDLATMPLPFHRQIWEYAPYAMALAALALLVWVAARLSGRMAAMLTAALGLAASPLVLSTQAAQAYHGTTWFGAALLAAFLCWLLTARAGVRAMTAVGVVVAAVIAFATASDPLLLPAGDAPFATALLLMWRRRPPHVDGRRLLAGFMTAAGAGAGAAAMLFADRLLGYASSFPRGLTHVVAREHLTGNVQQLVSGIFEVAGMPHGGSGTGIVLGLLLAAGILVPLAWLASSMRKPPPAPVLAVVAFWSASAVFLALAFVFSDIPADFLENSARYLVPMFYVAVGTVPLWAASSPRRLAAIAVLASAFILTNAAAVEHDASTGAFEPSFNAALPTAIAFLEQNGLTRGYAVYDEASPMTFKSDFRLQVRPVTELFAAADETCSAAICPFAYNSLSDWYLGSGGPTFILLDPGMVLLSDPPPDSLDPPAAVYHVDRFVIYVYGDDVAAHMGLPPKFTRPLL
jgi:hypothetical protein